MIPQVFPGIQQGTGHHQQVRVSEQEIGVPIGFLSEAERERLDSFPPQIVHADLITFFTLSKADRAQLGVTPRFVKNCTLTTDVVPLISLQRKEKRLADEWPKTLNSGDHRRLSRQQLFLN